MKLKQKRTNQRFGCVELANVWATIIAVMSMMMIMRRMMALLTWLVNKPTECGGAQLTSVQIESELGGRVNRQANQCQICSLSLSL
jgi:hypothetical protein